MIAALLVMMIVIGGAGAGYYYFFMRPSAPAKNPRTPERVQQSTPSRSRSGTEDTSSRTAGARRSATPQQLRSELVVAVNKGDVNTALELLRDKANLNFTDENHISLLQTVVMAEDDTLSNADKRRLVSAMVANGADVNYHGGNGDKGICTSPALSLAVQNDDPDVTGILLDAGAAPTIKDDNDQTALDYANMLRKSSRLKKSSVMSRLNPSSGSGTRQQSSSRSTQTVRTSSSRSRSNGDDASADQLNKLLRAKKVPD